MPYKDKEKARACGAKWMRERRARRTPEEKAKAAAANKQYYKDHPDYYINWGRRRREWFHNLKRTLACQECGETHPYCLDFHHRDPATKLFSISQKTTRKKEVMLAEIAKCDVLCANCHRKKHAPYN